MLYNAVTWFSIKIPRTEISFLRFHRSGNTVKTFFFPVVLQLALVCDYLNICRDLCVTFSSDLTSFSFIFF